jgi:hypothetical protein
VRTLRAVNPRAPRVAGPVTCAAFAEGGLPVSTFESPSALRDLSYAEFLSRSRSCKTGAASSFDSQVT